MRGVGVEGRELEEVTFHKKRSLPAAKVKSELQSVLGSSQLF